MKGVFMHIIISLIPCILLIIGTQDLPYGYYVFLRIFVFVYCAVHSFLSRRLYKFFEYKKHIFTWGFWLFAILFNPIFEVKFNKDAWVIVDIITAAFILVAGVTMYVNYKTSMREFDKYVNSTIDKGNNV
jgi:hypothetical protein